MKTVARKAADVCAAHRLLNWSQCTKGNLHRMPDLLIDIHKVDVHRQVSNFMNCKAVGRFAPFELSAVGALFEGVQTHSTNAIAKVIQRLVLFQEVLHHVVMAVQENNLNSNAATPSHLRYLSHSHCLTQILSITIISLYHHLLILFAQNIPIQAKYPAAI